MDAVLHACLDDAAQRYMIRNELRYRKYFGHGGRFFLDAGSGAKPRIEMSKGFDRHVCVDISLVGLAEARKEVGKRGLYVVADLAALPFKNESFEGSLASHCLYHIHKDSQPVVLRELYRVTKTDRDVIIFYIFSPCKFILKSQELAKAVIKPIMTLLGFSLLESKERPIAKNAPPLYSYAHNPYALTREIKDTDITCLRVLSKQEMQVLVKLHLFKIAAVILSSLEESFPHAMLNFAKYITIRIQKRTK